MTYELGAHQLLFATACPTSFYKTPYATIANPWKPHRIEEFS
jgi:hypothetical protein